MSSPSNAYTLRLYPLKILSVNRAWKGRRFKTKEYKDFAKQLTLLLKKLEPESPRPQTPLFAHYVWGTRSRIDVDNPTKPFQDVLFDYLALNDKAIEFVLLEKVRPDTKEEEFVRFVIDDMENLNAYLAWLAQARRGE